MLYTHSTYAAAVVRGPSPPLVDVRTLGSINPTDCLPRTTPSAPRIPPSADTTAHYHSSNLDSVGPAPVHLHAPVSPSGEMPQPGRTPHFGSDAPAIHPDISAHPLPHTSSVPRAPTSIHRASKLFLGQTFASKDNYFHAIVKDSWEQCRAAVIGSKKNDTKRHIWVCAYAKIDGKDVCPFRVTFKPVEA